MERQNIYDNPTWISSYGSGWESATPHLLGYQRESLVQAELGHGYTIVDLGRDLGRYAQLAVQQVVEWITEIDQTDIMQVQQIKHL